MKSLIIVGVIWTFFALPCHAETNPNIEAQDSKKNYQLTLSTGISYGLYGNLESTQENIMVGRGNIFRVGVGFVQFHIPDHDTKLAYSFISELSLQITERLDLMASLNTIYIPNVDYNTYSYDYYDEYYYADKEERQELVFQVDLGINIRPLSWLTFSPRFSILLPVPFNVSFEGVQLSVSIDFMKLLNPPKEA
jgi:hypothetical protein